MQAWKLFYDGGCNLCDASQIRASRWAAASGQPLQTEFLQSAEAVEKGYIGDEMILEADGIIYRGPDAWLRILRIAPLPLRWFSWMSRYQATRSLTKIVYLVVARFRYAIFGRRTCPLPGAKSRN